MSFTNFTLAFTHFLCIWYNASRNIQSNHSSQHLSIIDVLPLATVPSLPFPSELDPLSERVPSLLLSMLLFSFPVLQPWTAPFAKGRNSHEPCGAENITKRKTEKHTVSISLRLSISCLLSLISFEATHVFIWSLNRCEDKTMKALPIQNVHNWTRVQVKINGHEKLTCLTCNFLISFLRSASYFSFWFALAALWS